MKEVFAVFIGGGLGSITRFAIGKWVNTWHNFNFPFATLLVNVVACFALGLIIGLADHKQILNPTTRLFWAVGFCGGFSTFSAFSNDALSLLQQGHNSSLIVYVLGSMLLCVAATFIGLLIVQRF